MSMLYSRMVLPVVMVALCSGAFAPCADAADEFSVYGLVESFTWKEFVQDVRVVKENGPLFGIGGTFRHVGDADKLAVKVRGELFLGQVDYDGGTWDGIPVKTDTDYLGFKGEGDLGIKLAVSEHSFLEPFGGLGLRWWLRDIDDGTALDGTPVLGYTEFWDSLYFRLGLRGEHEVRKEANIFIEAGVKLPVYTQNTAYFSDRCAFCNDVTLEPENRASLFAEAGVRTDSLKITIFYEGLRFGQSDAVYAVVPDIGGPAIAAVFQPRSEADIVGITVGVAF